MCIRDSPAAGGILLEILENPVHLVVPAVAVLMLDPQLIAVGLADGALLVGPGVPDPAVELVGVVGLLLDVYKRHVLVIKGGVGCQERCIVGADTTSFTPENMAAGELFLYSTGGASVYLKNDGSIAVKRCV